MREISLNILDIIQNSIEAQAEKIHIIINEDKENNIMEIEVIDDGIGIDEENLNFVLDPFFTSRKSRKVGLGLSIFQSMCERCMGSIRVESIKGRGTKVHGKLVLNHMDRPPLGRIEDTIVGVMASNTVNLKYTHKHSGKIFEFDSEEVRRLLESDIDVEVMHWVREYIREGIIYIGVDPWS